MSIRLPLHKPLSHKFETVDVLLRNGSIIENLAIDASGLIIGKVVGGHDGIDESALPFKLEDIEAYRFRAGLAARVGLSKWQRLDQLAGASKKRPQ